MAENKDKDKDKDRDSYSDQPRGFETRAEREFEIGKDEAWFANVKRSYDEFLGASLEGARRSQDRDGEAVRRSGTIHDRISNNALSQDQERANIALQALQNAVETANMVGKQAVRHGDLSIDQQWNLEPSEAAAEATVLPAATIEALRTLMVESVGQAVKQAVTELRRDQ